MPDWLVKVKLLSRIPNSDNWSFAVPDDRTVTDVFPLNVVPGDVPPPPQPTVNAAVSPIMENEEMSLRKIIGMSCFI